MNFINGFLFSASFLKQELYDTHKLTTYPRTDSRFLPEDMMESISKTIRQLGAQDKLNAHSQRLVDDGLKNVKRNFDNAKVSDHYAIIPTGKIPPGGLSAVGDDLIDISVMKRDPVYRSVTPLKKSASLNAA